MKTEIWKDIPGYEGLYQVSNFGRLKSFKISSDGKIMKLTNKKGWYFTIVLQGINKPTKTTRIHRLVAELFIENTNRKPFVNHKDSNKQNNHYLNLEWVTSRENIIHSLINNPNSIQKMIDKNRYLVPKNIYQYTLDGIQINSFSNSTEAQNITGVCHRNILQVASKDEYRPGKIRHQAGGFIWSYENKDQLCII
jgi:hypothetical protein